MSTNVSTPPPVAGDASPTRRRALAVAAAALAPAALWLIARALDVELRVDPRNGQAPGVIGLPTVIGFALPSALLGWAALAVLERYTGRARTVWTALAVTVLLLSFLPLFMVGATGGAKTVLALMHVAVAAVLIPGLRGWPGADSPDTL